MPIDLLPDAAPIVRDFLLAHTDVSALVGTRVHAVRLPPSPTFPLVLVTGIVDRALIPQMTHAGQPRVQVEFYADDDPYGALEARTGAATCHAALITGLPAYDHAAGHVTDVTEGTGLTPLHDPDYPDNDRYLFDVQLTLHRRLS